MDPKFKINNKLYTLIDFAKDSESLKDVVIFTPQDSFKNIHADNIIDKYVNNDNTLSNLEHSAILGFENIFISEPEYFNSILGKKNVFKPYVASSVVFGRYKHYKGNTYDLLGAGLNIQTFNEMAIYRAVFDDNHDTGQLYARPFDMFFENVDVSKLNYIGPRFTLLSKFR